jgi:hypothetical protein
MKNPPLARRAPFRRRAATLAAAAGLAALLALSGGCAKAKAASAPEGPPLAVPAPPERVLAPVEEAQPLASTATTPEPNVTPPRIQPPPPRARRSSAAADQEPSDPAAPVTVTTPPPPAVVEPPRELRTTQSGADPRQVQQLIDRAERDLKDVDYGKLTREGQENYRLAQRYGREAKDALKDRNFLGAEAAAKKASSLAAGLLGSR